MNRIIEYAVIELGPPAMALLGLLVLVRIIVRLWRKDHDFESVILLIVVAFVFGLIQIVGKHT